uniref:Uncharacterized protein n=1 Tax=Physcomitrium patens TaxID=3218 RepID=A0A2K1IEH8_PHYPA|nr:hypothetical protein PHYPA_029831 [Physcomitrium patens]
MPTKLKFSKIFEKESNRGTPVVMRMENSNFDILEIDSSTTAMCGGQAAKGRGKNA